MTETRKYPIAGTDFFTKIRDENGYYIDKTDVIPWILSRKKQVLLFTRPRRFGKSTMMSMLKAFFEYRIDCDGKPIDNRHYFEGLKVSQDSEAMSMLGAYPVISLTLKDVIQERGRLSAPLACQIAIRILSALEHAHRNGIVHRDIIRPFHPISFSAEPISLCQMRFRVQGQEYASAR